MSVMKERQVCSACGKRAACGCNALYVSKLKYAAMHADPKKSDRANGKELGVGRMTIGRAGKQVSQNGATESKRKGLDGKMYPAEKKNAEAPRPRGRPPNKSRPPWAVPAPRRRKGESRREHNDRWAKIMYDKRLKELPDVAWEIKVVETLTMIAGLEHSWKEEFGDWRQFSMTPCTYQLLQSAADVLNKLLSELKFNKPNSKENGHVLHH